MAPYRSSGEEPKARSAVLKGARRRVRASGDFRFAPSSCDFVHDGGKNALDVGRVLGKVSAAFGGEIARCRRLEIAQNFARKGGNVLQISLNFGSPRMKREIIKTGAV